MSLTQCPPFPASLQQGDVQLHPKALLPVAPDADGCQDGVLWSVWVCLQLQELHSQLPTGVSLPVSHQWLRLCVNHLHSRPGKGDEVSFPRMRVSVSRGVAASEQAGSQLDTNKPPMRLLESDARTLLIYKYLKETHHYFILLLLLLQ